MLTVYCTCIYMKGGGAMSIPYCAAYKGLYVICVFRCWVSVQVKNSAIIYDVPSHSSVNKWRNNRSGARMIQQSK